MAMNKLKEIKNDENLNSYGIMENSTVLVQLIEG